MEPLRSTGPGRPDHPLPIAQVSTGMTVIDAASDEVGTVTAVEMPGTGIRPDLSGDGADDGAVRLMSEGYLRAGSSGLFAKAWYADGSQIADVTTTGEEGVVTLTVTTQELHRGG
ncbi:hypothetical protein AB0C29_04760 [Actinoplanes sp. NPDC048791]|uniref:hypothetical protein n=1 Tax=Actinoplanes sp. NPDC048791 TaxID=3154623 RepID=UPI00340887ED